MRAYPPEWLGARPDGAMSMAAELEGDVEFGPIRDVCELPSLADQPRSYPDARPPESRSAFALVGAQLCELIGRLDGAALDAWQAARGGGFAERTALLAVGSNAYPRQLFDKFAGQPCAEHRIITVPVQLAGCGVAFCPLLSRRGYVPVTPAQRAGRIERTWLQWLTDAQLARVRETEGPRYALVGGAPLAAALRLPDGLPPPLAVYAWWFDSVLLNGEGGGGEPLWFDQRDADAEGRVLERVRAMQASRLEIVSAPNPVPAGWLRLH